MTPTDQQPAAAQASIGVVVIGRNEGERLKRCLRSVAGRGRPIVYVDSGSTDGSVEFAQSQGVEVVTLDMTLPFTAARSRNAGFDRLLEQHPDLTFVQFVDGDCEMVEGWFDAGSAAITARDDIAVVAGRVRERNVGASIYNRLCDLEWDRPAGEVDAVGGIALMRVAALREVGGFDATLIAGEEPELCLRLRHRGWKVFRIDGEMTLHDAEITRFSQWWRRAVRSGHAYAEVMAEHRRSPGAVFVRQTASSVAWGLVLPVFAIAAAWPTHGWSLLLLLAYLALGFRIHRRQRQCGRSPADATLVAVFDTLGKIPHALGALRYGVNVVLGRKTPLIEYKGALSEGVSA